jgi:cytochrome P450
LCIQFVKNLAFLFVEGIIIAIMSASIPVPTPQSGLRALQAMLRQRHPLAALQVFHDDLGDVFRINLPGFTPVVMVGPQAARFVLVQARGELLWRNEGDPVVSLLRHGVLVEDGAMHDELRHALSPALHKRMLAGYSASMWQRAAQVTAAWPAGQAVDMLVEMRKTALLILLESLYQVDFTPQLKPLWESILGCIRYISPGLWMIWRGAPRPGYARHLRQMDEYLYQVIAGRRRLLDQAGPAAEAPPDLLGLLIVSGMDDGLIRDQLLTMLIAGHDTVTALMAWALYLLGSHPQALARATEEVRTCLDPQAVPTSEQLEQLPFLGRVIKEALRLYPPIHLGSRKAAIDLDYQGMTIPAGERVIYSIYLTQRDKAYWPDPHSFDPDRHDPDRRLPGAGQTPYSYLAFGGGPRNCIGAAFGQLEAKVVLAQILSRFDLQLVEPHVTPYMGATLEPHPGVRMKVTPGEA